MVAAYPFASLRRVSRESASLETLLARWTLARPIGAKVATLIGAPARVRVVHIETGSSSSSSSSSGSSSSPSGSSSSSSSPSGSSLRGAFDPFAALAEVRLHGQSFFVGGSSAFVRELAQRRLYGPDELAAPRPLSAAEHALFAGLVAAALVDAKIPGDVWPVIDADRVRAAIDAAMRADAVDAAGRAAGRAPNASDAVSGALFAIELALEIEGRAPLPVLVWCPRAMRVATPPPRPWPVWELEVPVIVGSCALHREDVGRLGVRDVITIDRHLGLALGEGLIALSAAPGAVEAKVASDYVRRDMALPDDAHLELTVQLGTTRLSLRQLSDLVPGSIVPLGRPLGGPFEVRAAGRLVGQGELVDVDGELGVRIVSLQE